MCQGNTFISMTFCSFLTFSYYIDEALFKINVRPFESEKFASAHSRVVGHEHKLSCLAIFCMVGSFNEAGTFFRRQHFRLHVVQMRHFEMQL